MSKNAKTVSLLLTRFDRGGNLAYVMICVNLLRQELLRRV